MSTIVQQRTTFRSPRVELRAGVARFVFARQRAALLRNATRGLAVGGLLAAYAGCLAQAFDLATGIALAAALALGAITAVTAGGWLRRDPEERIVLEIDRRLGLDERVTTALELIRQGAVARAPRAGGELSGLAEQQIADALGHLAAARPTAIYPIHVERRLLAAAFVTTALAIAPWLVPWSAFLGASLPPSRVALANQAEAARLDAVAQRLASQTSPADQSVRAQLAAQLRQAADALRRSQANSQQATRDLLQTEQAASSLAPRTGEDASLTLARIADALNNQPMTQPVTSALDQQDVQQAAADLNQLAASLGNMSAQQRQDLANTLQAASNASRGSETSAAQQLQQAADAARNGDAQGMQQAAQALQQLETANQLQRDVAQTQSELQSSREAISQASQSGNAPSQSPTDGAASSPSDPTDLTDQSVASDQTGAAQASSADAANTGAQGANGSAGAGQNDSSQSGGDQPGGGYGSGSTEHLGSPHDIQGLAQRQVTVPTNQSGDPTSISPSNQLQDGTAGTAQVDYVNVLPQYQQQAQQVVEGNVVPTGLKQIVKGYFDSLTPK